MTDPPQLILVIESDSATHHLLTETLEAKGHTIKCAANGAEALNILNWWVPDLILMDKNIPAIDGWAFVRAYHEVPFHDAPIIACAVTTIPGNQRSLSMRPPSSAILSDVGITSLVHTVESSRRGVAW